MAKLTLFLPDDLLAEDLEADLSQLARERLPLLLAIAQGTPAWARLLATLQGPQVPSVAPD